MITSNNTEVNNKRNNIQHLYYLIFLLSYKRKLHINEKKT